MADKDLDFAKVSTLLQSIISNNLPADSASYSYLRAFVDRSEHAAATMYSAWLEVTIGSRHRTRLTDISVRFAELALAFVAREYSRARLFHPDHTHIRLRLFAVARALHDTFGSVSSGLKRAANVLLAMEPAADAVVVLIVDDNALWDVLADRTDTVTATSSMVFQSGAPLVSASGGASFVVDHESESSGDSSNADAESVLADGSDSSTTSANSDAPVDAPAAVSRLLSTALPTWSPPPKPPTLLRSSVSSVLELTLTEDNTLDQVRALPVVPPLPSRLERAFRRGKRRRRGGVIGDGLPGSGGNTDIPADQRESGEGEIFLAAFHELVVLSKRVLALASEAALLPTVDGRRVDGALERIAWYVAVLEDEVQFVAPPASQAAFRTLQLLIADLAVARLSMPAASEAWPPIDHTSTGLSALLSRLHVALSRDTGAPSRPSQTGAPLAPVAEVESDGSDNGVAMPSTSEPKSVDAPSNGIPPLDDGLSMLSPVLPIMLARNMTASPIRMTANLAAAAERALRTGHGLLLDAQTNDLVETASGGGPGAVSSFTHRGSETRLPPRKDWLGSVDKIWLQVDPDRARLLGDVNAGTALPAANAGARKQSAPARGVGGGESGAGVSSGPVDGDIYSDDGWRLDDDLLEDFDGGNTGNSEHGDSNGDDDDDDNNVVTEILSSKRSGILVFGREALYWAMAPPAGASGSRHRETSEYRVGLMVPYDDAELFTVLPLGSSAVAPAGSMTTDAVVDPSRGLAESDSRGRRSRSGSGAVPPGGALVGGGEASDVRFFVALYASSEIYKFFPLLDAEAREVAAFLHRATGRPATPAEAIVRETLAARLEETRVRVLRALVAEENPWIQDNHQLWRVLENLTSERRREQHPYDMERLYHSCRLSARVTAGTLDALKLIFAEATSDTVFVKILTVVDRLLERAVLDPTSPLFFRVVAWLQAAEARLDTFRHDNALRVLGLLKAKLRRLQLARVAQIPSVDARHSFDFWDEYTDLVGSGS